MTYEEAIRVIESNRPTSGYTMLCEALDIAKEAIEKQIPKKPIRANRAIKINGQLFMNDDREALIEIKELIDNHWGIDPIYYTDSENRAQAEAARLCCYINEIINSVEDAQTF